jgi:hypothetical protein
MDIDIFGKLVAEPVDGGIDVNVEALRGVPDRGQNDSGGYQAMYWFRSTLHLKPNEVVDVALPKPDGYKGPLADRTLSIRIKSRQIR